MNTFKYKFKIDQFEKNNIFLSFNAIQGVCNLYLNSNVVYTFSVGAYQLFTKRILFGDIFVTSLQEDGDTTPIEILYNEASKQDFISNLYLTLEPLEKFEELAVVFSANIDSIQDLVISLPCGQRNLTDTFTTVNSINTNLKNKSNVVDINVKNLNIKDTSITDSLREILKTNIADSLPKSTVINNINIINYK